MSYFQKLKEMLVEDESAATPSATPPVTVRIPMPNGVAAPALVPSQIVSDNGMIEMVRSKTLPAVGALTTFIGTLGSLESYIPDEAARYRAAEGALKAQGISATSIAAQIAVALTNIDRESSDFNVSKEQNIKAEVTGRESQMAGLDSEIKQHQEQISSLTQKRETLAATLVKARTEIASKSEQFAGATAALKREYQDHLGKLKLYLGAT